MPNQKRTRFKDLFQGSGLTFIVVFLMEMIEEGLENLIALSISAVFSTILLVFATQLTKLGIKKLIKLIVPFVKQLLYKEGNDKVKKLKEFFSWLNANKCTVGGVAVGALTAVSGAGLVDVSSFPAMMIGGFNLTPVLYYILLGTMAIVCSFFPEKVAEFKARIDAKKAEKEAKSIIKVAEKELANESKVANQTQAQQEKAKAKADAEAKAKAEKEKAEREYRAKVDAQKAKLKAQTKS